MSRLIRGRSRNESGVVAVLISIAFGAGVFILLAALVVDIGAMQVERRQLQNGAEAAAVSGAYECSLGAVAPYGCGNRQPAISIASRNAKDAASAVVAGDLCGKGGQPELLPCSENTRSVRNCPNTPVNSRWAQVTASTLTSGGSPYLPRFFAQALPGFTPKTITACGQAAWGPPRSQPPEIFPMVLQLSCWKSQVGKAEAFGPSTYSVAASRSWERWFMFSTPGSVGCAGGATNSGFAWVNTGCSSTRVTGGYSYGSWLPSRTGVVSSMCQTELDPSNSNTISRTTPLLLPVYDCAYNAGWDATQLQYPGDAGSALCSDMPAPTTCSGTCYHVAGFAALLLSGYYFGAGHALYDGFSPYSCVANDKCLYGWFTRRTLISVDDIDDSAPDLGVNIVKLVG